MCRKPNIGSHDDRKERWIGLLSPTMPFVVVQVRARQARTHRQEDRAYKALKDCFLNFQRAINTKLKKLYTDKLLTKINPENIYSHDITLMFNTCLPYFLD